MTASQGAAVSIEAEPFYQAEARERQLATLKQNAGEQPLVKKITNGTSDETEIVNSNESRAAHQVAKQFGTNASYVYHAKTIKVQAPDVFEKLKAGEVEMSDAKREVKKRAQAEARKEAIASSPEIQVKAWDGTIKPNTVSLCSVFDLNLPANN